MKKICDDRDRNQCQDGLIRDAAILMLVGVNPESKRQLLGVSISLSEQEVHWCTFLQSFVARRLIGVRLIISANRCGLKAARIAIFGDITWQRCQFHLQQNVGQHVPHQEMRRDVVEDQRIILNVPVQQTAEAYLARTVQKYA